MARLAKSTGVMSTVTSTAGVSPGLDGLQDELPHRVVRLALAGATVAGDPARAIDRHGQPARPAARSRASATHLL